MKPTLVIFFLLLACTSFAQFKLTADTKKSDWAVVQDSVAVTDGNGKPTTLFVTASVSNSGWENLKNEFGFGTDEQALLYLTKILTGKAQLQLLRSGSFIPAKKQLIIFNEKQNAFECVFVTVKKNGNKKVETKTPVSVALKNK
jgi:hypothetical protein